MASLNKMMVIGNVGKDPEMRYTPNGNAVTSFTVATNRIFTVNGEKQKETEWFSVVAFGKLAEIVSQYVTKGRQVYVEGRLRSRTWTGQDGKARFTNEITANDVRFLGGPGGGPGDGEEPREAGGTAAGAGGPSVDAEDLPF